MELTRPGPVVSILPHAFSIRTTKISPARVRRAVPVAVCPVSGRLLVNTARPVVGSLVGAGLVAIKQKLKSSFEKERTSGACSFFPTMSEFYPSPSPVPDPKTLMAQVLKDLLIATHCHSCGASVNVALIGYCGTNCSKRCWEAYEFDLDFVCPWGGCVVCAGYKVSLARSKWRRSPADGWPMCHTKPCSNAIIASQVPIPLTHHHYDRE